MSLPLFHLCGHAGPRNHRPPQASVKRKTHSVFERDTATGLHARPTPGRVATSPKHKSLAGYGRHKFNWSASLRKRAKRGPRGQIGKSRWCAGVVVGLGHCMSYACRAAKLGLRRRNWPRLPRDAWILSRNTAPGCLPFDWKRPVNELVDGRASSWGLARNGAVMRASLAGLWRCRG